MPIYIRGVEPVAFRIGTVPVLRIYLGSVLIWDGTRSAVAQAIRAAASASVPTATIGSAANASAIVATANGNAFGATATTSAGGTATAATVSAAVAPHIPHAGASATAVAAAATAVVLSAVADQNFDATANAVAAQATGTVTSPAAVGAADAGAEATAATATTIVYDVAGGGSGSAAATAATATATAVAAVPSASASATAITATGSASAMSAIPSANAGASATAATASAAAASATGTAGRYYSDNVNRADASTLGADWRADRNGSPKVATNRAQMKTMGNGDGRAGNWTSYQGGSDSGRLATDKYAVKVQFITPVGNLATNNMTGGVLAVGDTFGAGVMAYFVATTGNGCAIYTQSGLPPASGISTGQTGQTQRAVTATNSAVTDVFEFRRERNGTDTAWVFNLYRNGGGSPFLAWEDASNLVSSGSAFRRWGFLVEGNYPIFNAEFRSPAVDLIEAYDL